MMQHGHTHLAPRRQRAAASEHIGGGGAAGGTGPVSLQAVRRVQPLQLQAVLLEVDQRCVPAAGDSSCKLNFNLRQADIYQLNRQAHGAMGRYKMDGQAHKQVDRHKQTLSAKRASADME
jgi:hypothetical protein